MSPLPPPFEPEPGIDASVPLYSALRYLSHFRLMLVCAAIGVLCGLIYFAFGVPVYYSRSLVRVTVLALPVDSDSGKVDGTAPGSLAARTFALRAFQQQLLSDFMQMRVAQKLGVASPGDSAESIRQSALQKVEISFIDSDHLEIGVFSPVAHVVREYAKTLITEYESAEREIRQSFRQTALDAYLRELDQYRVKLDEHLKRRMDFEQSTSLAQVFIQQNSLTQVPKDIVLAKDRLARMHETRDYLLAHGEGMDTTAKISLLNSMHNEKPVEVGSVVRDPGSGAIETAPPQGVKPLDVVVSPEMVESLQPWRELAKKQRQLQQELHRSEAVYQPGHAVMKNLGIELSAVEDKLKAELDVASQRFALEFTQLEDKLKSLEAKMPEYHEVTSKYERFRQDYDVMEKGQIDWNKAHAQMALNVAKLQFGADKERLHLDFAGMVSLRDENPVSPNKMKLTVIAVAMGLMLGVGIPTGLMFVDTTASHLHQLESKTGLKGIGVVPLTKSEMLEDIFHVPSPEVKPPSFVLETYRIIRNYICTHPGKHDQSQVIMVTSARPGEGKTLLAANLAWAFHTMGDRTLLVDCDLRRGRIAVLARMANATGMSRLLTGAAGEPEAIVNTGFAALDVIPCGPVIPGATELLCHKKFEALVAGWRTRYDRIIIDTPPVLGLGETSALQRVADGVIVVVRAHRTSTKDVAEATEMLRTSGAHLYGLVLNGVDMDKMANYYNYYYYSSDYYDSMEAVKPG